MAAADSAQDPISVTLIKAVRRSATTRCLAQPRAGLDKLIQAFYKHRHARRD